MPWDEWVLRLFERYHRLLSLLNTEEMASARLRKELDSQHTEIELLRREKYAFGTELEESGSARIRLEDEVRTLEQRNTELKEETAAARRETIETHRKFADHLAIVAHRRPVFDAAAPESPASSERPVNPTGKVYASEMAQRMTQLAIDRDVEIQALRRRVRDQEIEMEKHRTWDKPPGAESGVVGQTNPANVIPANIQQQMEEDILTGV